MVVVGHEYILFAGKRVSQIFGVQKINFGSHYCYLPSSVLCVHVLRAWDLLFEGTHCHATSFCPSNGNGGDLSHLQVEALRSCALALAWWHWESLLIWCVRTLVLSDLGEQSSKMTQDGHVA